MPNFQDYIISEQEAREKRRLENKKVPEYRIEPKSDANEKSFQKRPSNLQLVKPIRQKKIKVTARKTPSLSKQAPEQQKFKCETCRVNFTKFTYKLQHLRYKHSRDSPELVEAELLFKKMRTCRFCEKVFLQPFLCRRHIKKCHENPSQAIYHEFNDVFITKNRENEENRSFDSQSIAARVSQSHLRKISGFRNQNLTGVVDLISSDDSESQDSLYSRCLYPQDPSDVQHPRNDSYSHSSTSNNTLRESMSSAYGSNDSNVGKLEIDSVSKSNQITKDKDSSEGSANSQIRISQIFSRADVADPMESSFRDPFADIFAEYQKSQENQSANAVADPIRSDNHTQDDLMGEKLSENGIQSHIKAAQNESSAYFSNESSVALSDIELSATDYEEELNEAQHSSLIATDDEPAKDFKITEVKGSVDLLIVDSLTANFHGVEENAIKADLFDSELDLLLSESISRGVASYACFEAISLPSGNDSSDDSRVG